MQRDPCFLLPSGQVNHISQRFNRHRAIIPRSMPLIHVLKYVGILLTSWCLLCSGASASNDGTILMVTEATFPPMSSGKEMPSWALTRRSCGKQPNVPARNW